MTDPMSPIAAPAHVPGQRTSEDHPFRPHLVRPSDETSQTRQPARQPAHEAYAHWWRRVVATLIDTSLAIPFWVLVVIGTVTVLDHTTFHTEGTGGWRSITDVNTSTATWIGGALAVGSYLALLVFSIWNQVVRQGRRGASIGKACLHLTVVDGQRGHPIGAFPMLARTFAHLVDTLPLYLGYLWPLVGRRRQTFADMVMGTVVLHVPPTPAGMSRSVSLTTVPSS